MILFVLLLIVEIFFYGSPALATQEHGGPEGLYVHQLSHIFFAFSMGILIYWLRQRNLVKRKGWRYIQYSAIFFIFWTFDAFTVHFLSEQINFIRAETVTSSHIRIIAPNHYNWLEYLYFFAKLDHLLCVPGIFFLYLGLKSLLKETEQDEQS
jgi:hypothetical protein